MYKGVHRGTGEFYIGYRETNTIAAHLDLGGKYYTSSKYVTERGFDNFDWVIVAEFVTGKDAFEYEQRLIKEHFDDPLCLNGHYQDVDAGDIRHFRRAGIKHTDETREAIGNAFRGRPLSEEHRSKIGNSQIGLVRGQHSDETKDKISKATKGLKRSNQTRRKMVESWKERVVSKITCPHCGKVCDPGNAKRYHFDNCKGKE